MTSDLVFLFGVFGAGLLSFFAPCILPLIPVYVLYLSGSMVNGTNQQQPDTNSVRLRSTLVLRTFLFVLGLSLVFVLLGFGSGIVGNLISSPVFIAICGAIVVLFGIDQTGLIGYPGWNGERKLSSNQAKRGGYVGAFLLGLTFSFGWTPCIGPVLAAILGIAAGEELSTLWRVSHVPVYPWVSDSFPDSVRFFGICYEADTSFIQVHGRHQNNFRLYSYCHGTIVNDRPTKQLGDLVSIIIGGICKYERRHGNGWYL